MGARKLELTLDVVQAFRVGQVVRTHAQPVHSLDYNASGELLASTSGTDVLVLTDTRSGLERRQLPVRKYGAGATRFLADSGAGSLVVASTAVDHTIRALELARGSYARYYKGHTGVVMSIAASPVAPLFLSGSVDGTMRAWDVRKSGSVGRLVPGGTPAVAFDPRGVIFGVCAVVRGKTIVKLYDCKKYSQGPFCEFEVENPTQAPPACFRFSSDGECFLVTFPDATRPAVRVHDAYKGSHYRTFEGHRNDDAAPLEAAFSADAKCVFAGSSDGSVHVWDLANDRAVLQTRPAHPAPIRSLAVNPRYAQFATACQNVALWTPEKNAAEKALQY